MSVAAATLASTCDQLPGSSLDEVMALADLQTRVDRKYLVPAPVFTELMSRLEGRHRALDIEGRRLFDYESVYFDTPELTTYHLHAGDRRRRFKVRTRTYLDSHQTVLEVKTEGGRDETVKDRYPHELVDRYTLGLAGRTVVGERLGSPQLAQRLEPSLVSRYQRATLVEPATGSRMTCDVDLAFHDEQERRTGPDDLVLIESKTAGAAAPVDGVLWRMGHRPVSISKYCVGLALVRPDLPANRWNRTLRTSFGWSPVRRGSGRRLSH